MNKNELVSMNKLNSLINKAVDAFKLKNKMVVNNSLLDNCIIADTKIEKANKALTAFIVKEIKARLN